MADPSFVCFVALAEEMKYVHEHLISRGAGYRSGSYFRTDKGRHLYWLVEPSSRQHITLQFVVSTEMGNLATLATVLSELTGKNYAAAFCLGIAGTLRPEVYRLGDVVLANAAKWLGFDKVKALDPDREQFGPLRTGPHRGSADVEAAAPGNPDLMSIDMNKRIGNASWLRIRRDFVELERTGDKIEEYIGPRETRPPVGLLPVDEDLVPKRKELANPDPRLHHGSVYGSDWVVDSGDWVNFLLDRDVNFDADHYRARGEEAERHRTRWIAAPPACLDMESFGFFKALEVANSRNINGMAIRGISDPCAGKHDLEGHSRSEIRRIAAQNAALVLVDLLYSGVLRQLGT